MSDPAARAQASFERPSHAEGASHTRQVAARRHASARSQKQANASHDYPVVITSGLAMSERHV